MKLKRRKVLHDFKEEIDQLYDFTEEELSAVGGSLQAGARNGSEKSGDAA